MDEHGLISTRMKVHTPGSQVYLLCLLEYRQVVMACVSNPKRYLGKLTIWLHCVWSVHCLLGWWTWVRQQPEYHAFSGTVYSQPEKATYPRIRTVKGPDYVWGTYPSHLPSSLVYELKSFANFDPFYRGSRYPVLAQPIGRWAYPHCVAFYRNKIIDPGEPAVLSLRRSNMDYICGGRDGYLSLAWAKILVKK